MTQCNFLALALIFFFCDSCLADPLKKIRFQLDWYPDAERGGYICAWANGYYKEAGLDVEIVPTTPGGSAMANVVSGNMDMCMAPGNEIMLARVRGMPLVSIMATMQHDPQAVMVHEESDVKTLADLGGHAVAVLPGSTWLTYLTHKYHYDIQELRVSQSVANFLVSPQYIQQVFVTSEPYVCEQHGVKVRTLLIQDSGYDPYRVAVTTEQFLAKDPDAVQAFVTASIRGWKQYLLDPTYTNAEILKRNPAIDPGLLAYSRNALIQNHFVEGFADKGEAVGKLDPARYAAQYKILNDLHILPDGFDYEKAFTTQFCNK